MPAVLELSCQANKTHVPVLQQPQLVYVLAEIQPGLASANTRLPLNFTLVLDRSGSMAGEKLRSMKEAVCRIVGQLQPLDVISIVTFETGVEVLHPAQPAAHREALKQRVREISEGGETNMASGLLEGLAQVRQNNLPARASRLILLTDGEATDPLDDSRRAASEAGACGVPLIGMGFGRDWNEDFIQDLADRSMLAEPGSLAGYVDFIRSPEQAAAVFEQVFQSMQIVARDAVLTLRLVQGVEARRVWQVTPLIKDISLSAIQSRAVVAQLGDLEQAGAAYLIELMLPPRPAGSYRIAQADVSYNLQGYGMQRETADLLLVYASDPDASQQVHGRVMNVVERVTAFKLQTQALDEAQQGNVSAATQKLRQAVTLLLNQGETELAGQMEAEARSLEQGGSISSEGQKTIKLTSRKTVRLDRLE